MTEPKRKVTIAYTAFVTPEEDVIIRQYGDLLVQQNVMPKNTKYGIVRYFLDQVIALMTQSFVPGESNPPRVPAPPKQQPAEPQDTPVTQK
jgi:hypothetical protein